MQLRALGRSGLSVSPICLGTMTFGIPVEEPDAIRLVHGAMDLGINFIDTANVYEGYARFLGSAGGAAELILGHALKDCRDQVILATKVGAPIGPGPQDRGLSSVHVLRELENSLRRLQTDYIDLYISHWPDCQTPLEVTLSAMETAVRQGKIRHFGVSNHPAWQLSELQGMSKNQGGPCVMSSQIPFSMLRRELQNDLHACEELGIGVTPYQVLQGGLLTGKYNRGEAPPEGSRAAERPEWMWTLDDSVFNCLEALNELAQEVSVPLSQYALAWTLQQPAMSSLIVGVKSMQQIEDAVAALEVMVPPEHLEKINELCPPPWQQPDPVRGFSL